MLTQSEPAAPQAKLLLWASLLLAALAIGYAASRLRGVAHLTSTGVGPAPQETHAGVVTGPWGTLECTHIAIENPDEFISLNHSLTEPAIWYFEGYSPQRLTELLRSADLKPEERAALMDTNQWKKEDNAICLSPSKELILGLSAPARQQLYSVLAEDPRNHYQFAAYRYRSDGFQEWFDQSGLTPDVLASVKRLLYRWGPSICFSDLTELLPTISSVDQQRRLLKTLSRVSTLVARLHVEPGADVEGLVRYWGKQGHAKDIRPLLQSLENVPGGTDLDIAHLLPPFARMRLYTYPFPSEDPLAPHRDCFWSAMNFFNETPDDRFCDFEHTKEVIRSDYYPIQGDPSYGDVIWLIAANGRAIHAAVYLAGDIVFTKNGVHFDRPWVLMHFPDMLALFPSREPLRTVAYRLKTS